MNELYEMTRMRSQNRNFQLDVVDSTTLPNETQEVGGGDENGVVAYIEIVDDSVDFGAVSEFIDKQYTIETKKKLIQIAYELDLHSTGVVKDSHYYDKGTLKSF